MKIPAALAVCLLAAYAQDGPESVLRGTKNFQKKVVVSGLAGPWEITWGPDGMIWTTERTGKRVTRVNPSTGDKHVAITIDEVSAPGGQDGLLGMALHPELGKGTGNDYVYVAYTYVDRGKGPDSRVVGESNPYRYLYGKVVRLQYDAASGKLTNPVDIITGLPAGNDHNAMRLKYGPDAKLYLSLGDQGNNQLGNYCLAILSQRLPTADEMRKNDYSSYEGKVLRINPDGSIPSDNPKLDGVVSHIFTYGHRNTQGLDFAPDGTLYSSEHGPKTDDEINILTAGGNYGWPHVAGLKDDKAYEYARWAEAKTPCSQIRFSDLAIHPSVPREPESAFTKPMVDPLATMFTVPTGFNFQDPKCRGVNYICWPTVGVSGVEYYAAGEAGIPGWDKVLLVTTLKRGSLYVLPLSADGRKPAGPFSRYFQSENRYRDTAVSPDRRTIYIATDARGLAESADGGVTASMQDKGAILAFTYVGEGGDSPVSAPPQVSQAKPSEEEGDRDVNAGIAPHFTAAQVIAGKRAYDASCAVCHGSTMMNGTFGTPLAGEYMRKKWLGRTVAAFFEKSKTMPPAEPASLPDKVYADILAYIFEVNGIRPGKAELPASGNALREMRIKLPRPAEGGQ